MEFQRKDLKAQAKNILTVRYWPFFFIGLLQMVISGFGGISLNLQSLGNITNYPAFLTVIGGSVVLSVLVKIFLKNPFCVGYSGFVLYNSNTDTAVEHGVLWRAFKDNYLKNVKTMFVRDLFKELWSIPLYVGVVLAYAIVFISENTENYILFFALYGVALIIITAGLILALYKEYSYSMTEYVLAENAQLGTTDAIKKSKELMRGYTFFAFKLDISFMGWYILGAMLCGMGTFFVNPYYEATRAQFYIGLTRTKLY